MNLFQGSLITTLAILCSSVFGGDSEYPVVNIGTVDFPPYVNQENLDQSLGLLLVKRVFSLTDFEVSFDLLPAGRIGHYTTSGRLNGYFPGNISSNPSNKHAYTLPLVNSRYILASLKTDRITMAQFPTSTIGALNGWGLDTAFPQVDWSFVGDRHQLVPMIQNGRIDAFVDEQLTVLYMLNTTFASQAESFYTEQEFSPAPFGIGIVKHYPHRDLLILQLNKAIIMLTENGELERFVSKLKNSGRQ